MTDEERESRIQFATRAMLAAKPADRRARWNELLTLLLGRSDEQKRKIDERKGLLL